MSIRFKTLHLDKSSADFILFTWNHISLMPSNHSLCISDIWCAFILIEKQNADIDLSNIRRHTYHTWKIELKLHNMILSWHIYSQSILRLCSAKYNIFFFIPLPKWNLTTEVWKMYNKKAQIDETLNSLQEH